VVVPLGAVGAFQQLGSAVLIAGHRPADAAEADATDAYVVLDAFVAYSQLFL
jgi:hypothetical protein